ncbi:4-hydroxy-tetrahydrodipicolinate reductase [Accumulibacter sp.]|uniref:4-hydroxy-tetrahydrodipicolinate reductase n=1 Tax=Accumulibacter sp. TaxID=2053492 RepID=UPI0025D95364|nr:4-hydroxy-tetrahydrodipicolinate reductase [Accumulibacter sp.]MCM8595596.1 4-hydroxy-tetrahydrodipicolinate reductase [Accumulibacter sp.]MCM8624846.1 4-hydroxy-tetrahydrodipicolinate reductase [Accumulibacter sp.]MDS4049744.1 4-hydroxy-tetrahydrodipicolinate reductase [Accumulibacter sp.]
MSPVKIVVAGAGGRMGRMLIEATLRDERSTLIAAIDHPAAAVQGKDAGELVGMPCGIRVTSDVPAAVAGADCLIDFTRPEATLAHLGACRQFGVAMVIGTTGFTAGDSEAIAVAAQEIAIVMAPNMSVGVNVVFRLLDTAARILGEGYDVEIVEAHHRHKVDAPSGTALRMGKVVAQALGRSLEECAIYGREGNTGERSPMTIGFATVRGGDIVGDHTVMFCGPGERVEIGHRAGSRMPYALGSLRAARFLAGHQHGLFDMQDVLGLR